MGVKERERERGGRKKEKPGEGPGKTGGLYKGPEEAISGRGEIKKDRNIKVHEEPELLLVIVRDRKCSRAGSGPETAGSMYVTYCNGSRMRRTPGSGSGEGKPCPIRQPGEYWLGMAMDGVWG